MRCALHGKQQRVITELRELGDGRREDLGDRGEPDVSEEVEQGRLGWPETARVVERRSGTRRVFAVPEAVVRLTVGGHALLGCQPDVRLDQGVAQADLGETANE